MALRPRDCLGDTDLPLKKQIYNLSSKYSLQTLQRHIEHHHSFRPHESCSRPHLRYDAVTLDSMMHSSMGTIHRLHVSDKV